MVKLVNRARMSTSTTGTGTITLGSAENGYQSFDDAGVPDGDIVRYVIEDGSNWEVGTGTYTASGTTLTRTVTESSNSDAAINLSGSAVVFIGPAAQDFSPTITLAGDASGSVTLTDLEDATLTVTVADDSHNHTIANVDNLQTNLDAKLNLSGGTMTGNIVMSGSETVDGRDLSVDGAKLDGIEANATADQTDAEIKTAYENNSDTNAFTDAEKTKLSGIEANATADQSNAEIQTAVASGDLDMGSNNITTTGKVLFANVYSNISDLPSASTYHGMFAHVHSTGKGYFAHGGNWYELVNEDTSGNVTMGGNLTVSGDLTVSGTTTTVNTETINLADNQIVLNSNYTGSSPTEDGGIEIERGTLANKTLVWDETNDKWTVGTETFVSGDHEVTGNITVSGTVDGRDVATDGTKLDGIEANADVTDTANVTAAGALMDSEVTNLAQVKAFSSADYATAAQGTTADAALPKSGGTMTGAITFASGQTFDGRDVSADGAKLDGIESGATADQTAAEIRTLVESATDSNVFTDADHTKLNGISSGAEVNQNAFSNVAVSGQTTVAADGKTDTLTLAAGSNVTITTNASTDTVTIASTDTNTTYSAGSGLDLTGTTFSHTDTSSQASLTALTGAAVVSDIDVDTYGHVTNLATRNLTLANLGYTGETDATADQTASEILTAIKTVDGSGSGLDADTVDGLQASSFLRSDAADSTASTISFTGNIELGNAMYHSGDGDTYLQFVGANDFRIVTGNTEQFSANSTNGVEIPDKIVHTGDDDTYMQFQTANTWRVVAGGTEMLKVDTGGVEVGSTLDMNGQSITECEDIYLRDKIYHDGDLDTFIGMNTDMIMLAVGNEQTQINTSGIVLTSGIVREKHVSLTGTTPSVTYADGGSFDITLSGNTTFTFGAASSGYSTGFIIEVTGDASTAYTITWPAVVDWAGGTAPDAPAVGEKDIYVFWTRDGGTIWHGALALDASA